MGVVALNLAMPLLSIVVVVCMSALLRDMNLIGKGDRRAVYFSVLWCGFASVLHSVSLSRATNKTARTWIMAGAVLDVIVVACIVLVLWLVAGHGGLRRVGS
jgi:hypothetical protein